jgi:ankyrin repeat protein
MKRLFQTLASNSGSGDEQKINAVLKRVAMLSRGNSSGLRAKLEKWSVDPECNKAVFLAGLLSNNEERLRAAAKDEPPLVKGVFHKRYTPLGYAVTHRLFNGVRVLLELGADPNDTIETTFGGKSIAQPLLMFAAVKRLTGIADLLMCHGANVKWMDSAGLRLPHILLKYVPAHSNDPLPMLRLLFDHAERTGNAYSVDERCSEEGLALLHMASNWGFTAVAAYLLDKGANVNIQDASGLTPLHCAVMGGRLDTVQVLLASGCSLDLADNAGRIPESIQTKAKIRYALNEARLARKHGVQASAAPQ